MSTQDSAEDFIHLKVYGNADGLVRLGYLLPGILTSFRLGLVSFTQISEGPWSPYVLLTLRHPPPVITTMDMLLDLATGTFEEYVGRIPEIRKVEKVID